MDPLAQEALPIGRLAIVKEWVDPRTSRRVWPYRKPLFQREGGLRQMVAVVSEEILGEAHDPRTAFLLGLLHDDHVDLLRYAESGPPDVQIAPDEPWPDGVPGWILFRSVAGDVLGEAITTRGKGTHYAAVKGKELLRLATIRGASLYGDSSESQNQCEADVMAGLIATTVGADIIVTRRPVLLDQPFDLTPGTACMTPEAALPVVGLYLRQQGRYILQSDPQGRIAHSISPSGFYMRAADSFPAGRRWIAACQAYSIESGDDTLRWLASSLYERAMRSLQARDRLHAALLVPQDNATADRALVELDVLLVYLMGMFDATARVAHLVLESPGKLHLHDVGWQRTGWLKHVRPLSPKLADIVALGSVGHSVLTVVRLLRNSVHGETLPPLAVSGRSLKREDTLVGLPRADRDKIKDSIEILGGAEAWGLKELIPERLHADIRVLVERLFPATMTVVNALLEATPFEHLPNITSSAAPPAKSGSAPDTAERIRWQLGL